MTNTKKTNKKNKYKFMSNKYLNKTKQNRKNNILFDNLFLQTNLQKKISKCNLKKRTKKLYKMKGGNSFNAQISNNIEEFNNILKEISLETIKFTYMSIGSRYRENKFVMKGLYSNNNYTFISNSLFQVFPSFLRKIKGDILLIIVDSFIEETDIQKQINMLNSYIGNKNIKSNIKIIIHNDLCNKEFIINLNNYLTNLSYDKSKFMICDFVKFKTPNLIEQNTQTELPEMIYSNLGHYNSCLYIWCGYKLLNLICKYTDYENVMKILSNYIFIKRIEKLLQTEISFNPFNNLSFLDVEQIYTELNNYKLFKDLCNMLYDLTFDIFEDDIEEINNIVIPISYILS